MNYQVNIPITVDWPAPLDYRTGKRAPCHQCLHPDCKGMCSCGLGYGFQPPTYGPITQSEWKMNEVIRSRVLNPTPVDSLNCSYAEFLERQRAEFKKVAC